MVSLSWDPLTHDHIALGRDASVEPLGIGDVGFWWMDRRGKYHGLVPLGFTSICGPSPQIASCWRDEAHLPSMALTTAAGSQPQPALLGFCSRLIFTIKATHVNSCNNELPFALVAVEMGAGRRSERGGWAGSFVLCSISPAGDAGGRTRSLQAGWELHPQPSTATSLPSPVSLGEMRRW